MKIENTSRRYFGFRTAESECPVCGDEFAQLDEHMCDAHGRPALLACDWCPQMFTSGSTFAAHVLTHKPSVFTCHVCCLVLDSKNLRCKHLFEAHGCYECAKCGAAFCSEERLLAHQRRKRCRECLIFFESSAELDAHVKQHSHRFLCELCGRDFKASQLLQIHWLTHGAPRFECAVCGVKCKNKVILALHITYKHFPRQRLRCDFCGKWYANKDSLRKHVKLHDTERPVFECLVCRRTFSQSNILKVHMKLHRGELDFECDRCDAAFIRSNHLVRHRLEKHQIKEYKCLPCSLEFEKLRQLKSHNKQKHFKLT